MTFYFILSLSMLIFVCNPHTFFPLYRNGYRAICLFDPQSPVSTVSPSFSLQLYSSSKIWYSGCRRHDWCLFTSCQAPIWCCWQCLWCEAREGLVQLLHHHCSLCPNTPLGWYVPHVFIVSAVGCVPSSYWWVPVIVGPNISNFCYFKILLRSLMMCMIRRCPTSLILYSHVTLMS